MIRDTNRIGDVNPFGQTCQPACTSGGTLCPDPNGFLASLNPCCSTPYVQAENDGYCGGGSSPTIRAITSQTGGAQDPCTAGGLLCPQPNSPGAWLNPCCSVDAKTASGDPKPATDPNTKLLYGFIAAAFGIALLKGLSK